jgi:hypothetical protein
MDERVTNSNGAKAGVSNEVTDGRAERASTKHELDEGSISKN